MDKITFDGKDLGVETEEKITVDYATNKEEELCQEELDMQGLFKCAMENINREIFNAMYQSKKRYDSLAPKLEKKASKSKNKKSFIIKVTKEELSDIITSLKYSSCCIDEDLCEIAKNIMNGKGEE